MTPEEEKVKYNQELAELEFQTGGVFAISTPERHKKRWEQKAATLKQEIAEARDPEEKERLQQKLIELKRMEKEIADHLAFFFAESPTP